MKKLKFISTVLMFVFLFSLLLPLDSVLAATYTVESLNLEVSISDDTIVLTKGTANTDPKWTQAGIIDVSKKKNEMNTMNISAIFYDPKTGTCVQLLSKDSTQSRDILNLSYLTEEERDKFYQSLTESADQKATLTSEAYHDAEYPFFRYTIDTTNEEGQQSEILYGTIMNGNLIWYDIYSKDTLDSIDETYIQSLVNTTHFTYVMTKEDYARIQRTTTIQLIVLLIIVVALIVGIIIRLKSNKKKKKLLSNIKAKRMQRFYDTEKKRTETNTAPTLKFKNKTVINEAVLKQFFTFTYFKNRIMYWSVSTILAIAIIVFLAYSSNGFLKAIIAIVLVFIYVYTQGIQVEKSTNQAIKRYDKKNGSEIITNFYEDHLVTYLNHSPIKYAYIQLLDIKCNQDFIYLYYSPDEALYLKKDGFDGSADEFVTFMTTIINESKAEAKAMYKEK